MSDILKIEHHWDEENDRWIMTSMDVYGEFGLNFMQGDEYDLFVKDYGKADPKLTAFYKTILEQDIVKGSTRDIINKVCWAWINLRTGSANEVFGEELIKETRSKLTK